MTIEEAIDQFMADKYPPFPRTAEEIERSSLEAEAEVRQMLCTWNGSYESGPMKTTALREKECRT